MRGAWSDFEPAHGTAKSWIGRAESQQSFDAAGISNLRRTVARNANVDESILGEAMVSGCLGNTVAVEFPQRAGGFDVVNAGALLNYPSDRHLAHFVTHFVKPPADLTPPKLPKSEQVRSFVMQAIEGRLRLPDRASVKVIRLGNPFLYAANGNAVWATDAKLEVAIPDVGLPDDVDVFIDLSAQRLLASFNHVHRQTQYKANVFRHTPLTRCTHYDYMNVIGTLQYDDVPLDHLNANALTATGDYATFSDIDKSERNDTWTCEDGRADCDFHFTWNGQPQKFAEVMTYYHVTEVQKHVQDLGFQHLSNGPIAVDVRSKLGKYLAEFRNDGNGKGVLLFGDDLYGHNVARDPKVIVHEYGHALQAAAVWDRLDGAGDPSAVSEGFADYLALSTFAEDDTDECRQCVGAFMNNGRCYRSLNDPNDPVPKYDPNAPDISTADPHHRGRIWTEALWLTLDSVHNKVASHTWNEARRIVDRGALMGHCFVGHTATEALDMKQVALATLAAVKADAMTTTYFDDFCYGFREQKIVTQTDCDRAKNPSLPLN